MISNEATIRVRINGKDAEVSIKDLGKVIDTTMKKARDSVKKTKSTIDKLGDFSQKFFFAYNSLRTITSGINSFISASDKQEKAVAGVAQVMKSMGRYTDEAFESVQKLASQIQNEGIISDEDLLMGTKFLMTYKGISEDVMPKAMRVMADFAALTGGDVTSAANILGKASMGLTGQLARYGITLSDTAKESKDFSLILNEIATQVGGQNRAMAETDAGALQQWKNTLGDLQEVGGALIKKFVIPLTKLMKPIAEGLQKVNTNVLAAVTSLGVVALTITKVVIPAMKAAGVASKTAFGWVGLIVAAIEMLYTAWVMNFGGIQEKAKAFWQFIKNWMNSLGEKLSAFVKILEGIFTFNFDKAKEGWNDLTNSIVDNWEDAFKKIKVVSRKNMGIWKEAGEQAGESFQQGVEDGREKVLKKRTLTLELSGAMSKGERLIEKLKRGEELVKRMKAELIDEFFLPESGFKMASNWLDKINEQIKEFSGLLFDAGDVLARTLSQGLDDILDKSKSLRDVWKDIGKSLKKEFIKSHIDPSYILSGLKSAFGFQQGANFIVPPGFNNDSFAMGVSTGEHVQITPANKVEQQEALLTNVVRELRSISRILSNQDMTIINRLDSNDLYRGISNARKREKIRLGEDINERLFQ